MRTFKIKELAALIADHDGEDVVEFPRYGGAPRVYIPIDGPIFVHYRPPKKHGDRILRLQVGHPGAYQEGKVNWVMHGGDKVVAVYQCGSDILAEFEDCNKLEHLHTDYALSIDRTLQVKANAS